MPKRIANEITTYNGHPLTNKEALFIDKYVETSNGQQSVIDAGYNTKSPRSTAQNLLRKSYIAEEIAHRVSEMHKANIATAEEVMDYFSKVMNGEIKDQFGLEAPLSERTKAAVELAKRLIDMPNKLENNKVPEIKISLDWASSDSAENAVKLVKDIVATPHSDLLDSTDLDLT